MKKTFVIIMSLALAALALTACGQSPDSAAKDSAASEAVASESAAATAAPLEVPELSNAGMAEILAQSQGKVVFLCFWSVSCPACDRELPELEALADKYSRDELRLLLVNVDPTAKQVPAYFGDYRPLGEVWHGTNDLAEAYGIYKIPHLVMYTAEGVKLLDQSGYFPSAMLEALVEHGLGRGEGAMGSSSAATEGSGS